MAITEIRKDAFDFQREILIGKKLEVKSLF